MPSIKFALGLKPAKAIEWLQAKGVTAENMPDMMPAFLSCYIGLMPMWCALLV